MPVPARSSEGGARSPRLHRRSSAGGEGICGAKCAAPAVNVGVPGYPPVAAVAEVEAELSPESGIGCSLTSWFHWLTSS